MLNNPKRALLAVCSLALLPACGGGEGDVASTPPTPPIEPAERVEIFQNPAAQEFAALGSGDPLRIRYDATTKQYQVSVAGANWDRLVDAKNQAPLPGDPNQSFAFASASSPNASYFMTRVSDAYPDAEYRYQYSNLAAWGIQQSGKGGYVAFGMATEPGRIPVTGSGNYKGLIEGSTTVDSIDWDGNTTSSGLAGGSVSLRFDFAAGALSGEIRPFVDDKGVKAELGSFAFVDTVFSPGSASFSGKFDSGAAGENSFSGLFTGPGAEELIGQWTVPFIFKGVTESATGALVAKRGN